jgi:hypothetical protein
MVAVGTEIEGMIEIVEMIGIEETKTVM